MSISVKRVSDRARGVRGGGGSLDTGNRKWFQNLELCLKYEKRNKDNQARNVSRGEVPSNKRTITTTTIDPSLSKQRDPLQRR